MSRIRKARILEGAQPVSEYESAAREGMESIAAALIDVAASLCFEAATKYQGTAGEQRQIAGTMFQVAQRRFKGLKVDGVKLDDATADQLEKMWRGLIDGRKRR
jgi:hypothetical protein